MTGRPTALLLLLAASACATGARTARPPAALRADEPLTAATALHAGSAAEAAYRTAWEHRRLGDAARDSGNLDRARAEWALAADGLLEAERLGAAAHRLPLRYRAAQLYGLAEDYPKAVGAAERVARDPAADDASRALGWHLAAHALVNVASAEVRGGRLPPVKLLYAEQRGAQPLAPIPPPGAWKAFAEATDAYLAVAEADPELKLPPDQRPLLSPGKLALGAAKVAFGFDDLPDARRRLAAVLERWPDDAELLVEVVPLYLQTFLVPGDRAGYQEALARVRQLIETQRAKADPRGGEAYDRVKTELLRTESGAQFAAAQRLLDAGRPAEAAQAFEAIAAGDAAAFDAAGALHNAAIAWDRAEQPTRAAAARERILAERPDAKVAPGDALLLAASQSRKGDHGAAARLYGEFLERWPDHANRCIARQNVASELDAARRGAEAAERYLAFGKDPLCARADPALAASALRRARSLFDASGKPARAREAAAEAQRAGEDARRPAKEK